MWTDVQIVNAEELERGVPGRGEVVGQGWRGGGFEAARAEGVFAGRGGGSWLWRVSWEVAGEEPGSVHLTVPLCPRLGQPVVSLQHKQSGSMEEARSDHLSPQTSSHLKTDRGSWACSPFSLGLPSSKPGISWKSYPEPGSQEGRD